jgi:hypothetical protein
MKRWLKNLFTGGALSGQQDVTERFIEQLQVDLAHERAINATLISALTGREPRETIPQVQIDESDLQSIVRRSPLLSQLKHRAHAVLERERVEKEKERKNA